MTAEELEQFVLDLEARVAELEGRVAALEAQNAELAKRVDAFAGEADAREHAAQWWDTYNAALTKAGIFAHGPSNSSQQRLHINEIVHATCKAYADFAHGPLVIASPASHFDEQLLTKDGEPLNLAPEIPL